MFFGVLGLILGFFLEDVEEHHALDLQLFGEHERHAVFPGHAQTRGSFSTGDVLAVFGNPAPITVAAMFVLSAALVRCGALDGLSAGLDHAAHFSYRSVIFLLVVLVAFVSAWINNTPVVVVFVPVVITLARRMSLPASKFLIPLSYAAVLGGTCTLIGTSTNLVVNGILAQRGIPEMGMFELTWIGVPATLVGAVYLALAGGRLLPARENLTSILSDEERREYFTEAFVPPDSRLIGKSLRAAGLVRSRGFRVIEVVRDGVSLHIEPTLTPLAAGDRLILACRPSDIARVRAMPRCSTAGARCTWRRWAVPRPSAWRRRSARSRPARRPERLSQ